jgi:hypothetical protein
MTSRDTLIPPPPSGLMKAFLSTAESWPTLLFLLFTWLS